MLNITIKNSNKLLIVLILQIGILTWVTEAAVFSTRKVEDAEYWHKIASSTLHRILKDLHSEQIDKTRIIAKNVIIFVGDGMGMSTITASRIYKGQREFGVSGEESSLAFEQFPHVGLAKTYNVNKQVPDSAGTATALFSGVKTNYGVIGLDAIKGNRLTSLMDWAIQSGRRTGFVTTTRVTHATPAALYAHSPNRDWECDSELPTMPDNENRIIDIARQLVEQVPGNRLNVIMGGGKQQMGSDDPVKVTDLPKFGGKFEKYCNRTDGRNLIDEWLHYRDDQGEKRVFVKNTGQLLSIDPESVDYLLGLFADNHMTYTSIRDEGPAGEPSLSQMTRQAIRVLQRKNSQTGFVLMVEGGRIDQAHHQNHAGLALEECVEMDKAVQVALNETNVNETLIIVTADHSHSVTLNGYPVRGNDILGFANKNNAPPQYETLTYANGPGFWKHLVNLTDDGTVFVTGFDEISRQSPLYRHQAMLPLEDESHGGEDVPVYASGPGASLIRGVFEQNYVAYTMSYVGCMGPAKNTNLACGAKYVGVEVNGSTHLTMNAILFILLSLVGRWVLL